MFSAISLTFFIHLDDLVLSQDDFIIYLDKFYYDVRDANENLLSFLKCFYLYVF